ncbi:class F sortase [Streptomyces sp. NPDC048002]|uniref:class F sortase n=1 Tax=Streptomyces sp. NPDC048002 TaxID=3154344 RepID=UPI0033E9C50E
MSPLSRRAFGALALASPLVACGPGDAGGGSAGPSAAPARDAEGASAPDPSEPAALLIPAIGVDTPLIRLGLAPDGTVEVPPVTADDRAGWYEHSPAPGRIGPSVLLGHVTVGEYGDGVFRRLGELRPGDRIVARLENGTAPEFAVTRVRTVAKSRFPTEEVYGNVDRPELRLITCGGPRGDDGYRDNVIVFAAPAPGTSGER